MAIRSGPVLKHIDPIRFDASAVADGTRLHAHCKDLGIDRSQILDYAKASYGWSRTTEQNGKAGRDLLEILRVCTPGSVVMLDLGQERADLLANLTPHEIVRRAVSAYGLHPVLVTISEPAFGEPEWDGHRWNTWTPPKRRRRPPKPWTGPNIREPSPTGTRITWGLRQDLSHPEEMDLIRHGDHKGRWYLGPTAHAHHYIPGTLARPCPAAGQCQEYPRLRGLRTLHARNGDLIHGSGERISTLTQDIAYLQESREQFEKILLHGYDICDAGMSRDTANVLRELAAAYERLASRYDDGATDLDRSVRQSRRAIREQIRARYSA